MVYCFMFLSLKHYDKCYFMFNSLKMFYCVLVNNDTNNNQIYYIMKFSYVYLIFDDYIMFIIQSYHFMCYKLFPLQIITLIKCDK